jgi:hypothetical protein
MCSSLTHLGEKLKEEYFIKNMFPFKELRRDVTSTSACFPTMGACWMHACAGMVLRLSMCKTGTDNVGVI